MVRRYYIVGGNNVGDPPAGSFTVTDPYFDGRVVSGVFKEGFRYYVPLTEWEVAEDTPDTMRLLVPTALVEGEVIAIEVGPRMDGATCSGTGEGLDDVDPYLPDIVKCIVARVNSVFSGREDDPFPVYYDHGIYEQVGSDRLKSDKGYLFVWLVMPFTETAPTDDTYFEDATCKLLIAIATEKNYTQAQREDINFHPRLLPVYKQLIHEIKQEVKLDNSVKVDHSRRLLPYWGGGDINAAGQPNLWRDSVDCIEVSNLKLKVGHGSYCTFTSNF